MTKKIAIIGSGASGITAIKCCLDEGLTPVCFERTNIIGGLWYYTEKVEDGQSCVMKSTVINTSKEIMAYSDFPIPADFPVFMHNTKVIQYLHLYAKHIGTEKYTRFNTEILKVKESDDFEKSGQWVLTIKDKEKDTTSTEVFDGVMVCTGHHAEKNIPKFEGIDAFKGKVVHTHDYRSHVGYEDKKVLVIGIGNSGGDVAVELSRVSRQVYLSTRRGAWVINRISHNGYPADLRLIRRSTAFLQGLLPRSIVNALGERIMNSRFNHANYGLKPKHRAFAQHPTINDDLPNRIACGTVIIKPNIRKVTPTGVEFEDGSMEDNIDVIILATGFKFGFPFIDNKELEVKNNDVNFYKYVFPPNIRPGTLALIGFVQPLGAIMPISEIQCRWAARVFKGVCTLPSPDTMWADIRKKKKANRERYVDSPRHTIQVDYVPIMDDIAMEFGAKPDLGKLIWDDPLLAMKCIFGPFVPYHYRLMGPGRWDGARQAIMTVWDRTLKATNPKVKQQQIPTVVYVVGIIVLAVLLKWALRWFL